MEKLSREDARLVAIAAQGLDAPGAGVVPVVERTGFLRTLGGVEAYLALFARVAGLREIDVRRALAADTVRVSPAVRGCIYVVPRRDAAVAMRFAAQLSSERLVKESAKAGIKKGELEKLGEKVLAALAGAPLSTEGLKQALPGGSVRALGEAGKKVGISSTLPPALRMLEHQDRIERVPESLRLDSEKYVWRPVGRHDGQGVAPGTELARLGEVFLRAAGVGQVKEFAAWAGVAQRDARAVLEALPSVEVTVEGVAAPGLMLASDLRSLLERRPAAKEAVALLPLEDNLHHLHAGPSAFVEEKHHGVTIKGFGNDPSSKLGRSKHLAQRAVLAEGKLVGFWDYDPDARQAVTALFDEVTAETQDRIDAAAAATGRFLADEIGHGRTFSLDTDDYLRQRVAWLRSLRPSKRVTGGRRGRSPSAGAGAPPRSGR